MTSKGALLLSSIVVLMSSGSYAGYSSRVIGTCKVSTEGQHYGRLAEIRYSTNTDSQNGIADNEIIFFTTIDDIKPLLTTHLIANSPKKLKITNNEKVFKASRPGVIFIGSGHRGKLTIDKSTGKGSLFTVHRYCDWTDCNTDTTSLELDSCQVNF